MANFLLAYRSAKNGRQAGTDHMAAWQTFFDGLGSHLVDAGNPIFTREELGDCSHETTILGGYSIIAADDLESAVALARACPELAAAGGVTVGEITPLSPESVVTGADDHARATGARAAT
jgi:hypothetical protein